MWIHLMFIILIVLSLGCTLWFFKWEKESETIYAASSTLLAIIKLLPRRIQKIIFISMFSLITISITTLYINFIVYR